MLKRRRAVPPTRISARDLLSEAASAVLARPGRTVLTMLAVVLGVGTLVGVVGLTGTANGQVSKTFTALKATEVVVNQAPPVSTDTVATGPVFPADADQLAARIKGVQSAGVVQDITGIAGQVSGVPIPGAQSYSLPIQAATAGFLPAIRAQLSAGRIFDTGAMTRADPVAVLGASAAQRLGITQLASQPVIFVNGAPLTVIGIVSDVARNSDVLSSVIIPATTAQNLWAALRTSNAPAASMVVDTQLGAAPVVAQQIALALRPDDPTVFAVVPPPDPHTLQDNVQSDLGSLFLVVALVSLVAGMIGIANTTFASVNERTGEIGLRRALGARKRHICVQFLAESAFIGTLGGLIGAALGVIASVAVAVNKNWTPILDMRILLPSPLGGTIVGILAGLYSAVRAARIPPAEAFRR